MKARSRRFALAAFTRVMGIQRERGGMLDRARNRAFFNVSDVAEFLLPHLDVPSSRWSRAQLDDALARFSRAARADSNADP